MKRKTMYNKRKRNEKYKRKLERMYEYGCMHVSKIGIDGYIPSARLDMNTTFYRRWYLGGYKKLLRKQSNKLVRHDHLNNYGGKGCSYKKTLELRYELY